MKRLREKIMLAYIPFLLIAIGYILIYTLLNWYFTVKINNLSIPEELSDFWLPFFLAAVPVLLFLRPQLKLLELDMYGTGLRQMYFLAAAVCIIPSAIIMQYYLRSSTGTLIAIENIAEIDKHEPAKYYTLKNYCIDQGSGVGIAYSEESISKGELGMRYDFSCPLMPGCADTVQPAFNNWLCTFYQDGVTYISLEYTDKGKNKHDKFFDEAYDVFSKFDIGNFQYLERIYQSNEFYSQIEAGAKNSVKYNASVSNSFFKGVNEPFEERTGHKLMWAYIMFATGAVVWFLLLLYPNIKT